MKKTLASMFFVVGLLSAATGCGSNKCEDVVDKLQSCVDEKGYDVKFTAEGECTSDDEKAAQRCLDSFDSETCDCEF